MLFLKLTLSSTHAGQRSTLHLVWISCCNWYYKDCEIINSDVLRILICLYAWMWPKNWCWGLFHQQTSSFSLKPAFILSSVHSYTKLNNEPPPPSGKMVWNCLFNIYSLFWSNASIELSHFEICFSPQWLFFFFKFTFNSVVPRMIFLKVLYMQTDIITEGWCIVRYCFHSAHFTCINLITVAAAVVLTLMFRGCGNQELAESEPAPSRRLWTIKWGFLGFFAAASARLKTSIKEVYPTSFSWNTLTALLSEIDHGSLLCKVKPVF